MSTILTGVSNLKEYLENWSLTANDGWTYGAFWNPEDGLITDEDELPQTGQYSQWGDGLTGGTGVLLEGDGFYYDKFGNVYGNVDALAFGSNFSASNEDGIGLVAELTLTLDQSFDYSQAGDAFDYAIHGIYADNSLSYLYDYLAETGTVVVDTDGDDVLVGFAGADRFVFTGGNDIVANDGPAGIYGYQDGLDTLDVSAWGVVDFGDLVIEQDGDDAFVFYGDNSIQLAGVDSLVLDASDFIFAQQLDQVA